MDAKQHNLALLNTVARHLGELRSQVVFLGGATTSLLTTDPASVTIRATRDVVFEAWSLVEYQTRLRPALLAQGFREDTEEGAPLCRWRHGVQKNIRKQLVSLFHQQGSGGPGKIMLMRS